MSALPDAMSISTATRARAEVRVDEVQQQGVVEPSVRGKDCSAFLTFDSSMGCDEPASANAAPADRIDSDL